MDWLSTRTLNSLAFASTVGLLMASLYFQFGMGLQPCPLCIFERIGVFVMSLLFLALAIHNPKNLGARVYAALILVVAIIGSAITIRHVWLQNIPPEMVPACGPDLSYLMRTLPIADAVLNVLKGSGDCAEIKWTFLGYSMPVWILVWYVGYTLYSLLILIAPRFVDQWMAKRAGK